MNDNEKLKKRHGSVDSNFIHIGLVVLLFNFFNVMSLGQQPESHSDTCAKMNYTSVMMHGEAENHLSSSPQTVTMTKDFSPNHSDNKALAVVIYDEKNLFPHQKSNRTFNIAGHKFNIVQDWHGGGVAAVVWDAAVVLGEYLASHSTLVKGKRVLELGAGTGLAGMVAATLGADVVVTERKEALSHLESAISDNQAGMNWRLQAAVLDWTDEFDAETWGHFDIVVGADIVYVESTFHHLLKTLKAVSSSPKTLVLLSCRIRYDRDRKFLHMLKKFFTVVEIFYHSDSDIRIFSAVWKS